MFTGAVTFGKVTNAQAISGIVLKSLVCVCVCVCIVLTSFSIERINRLRRANVEL